MKFYSSTQNEHRLEVNPNTNCVKRRTDGRKSVQISS